MTDARIAQAPLKPLDHGRREIDAKDRRRTAPPAW
jgi:hypothetical protein